MRIAYIIEHVAGFGGLERNITAKSNYLVEKYAYEVTIVTVYQNGRPYSYPLNSNIRKIDLGLDFTGKTSFTIKKRIRSALEPVLLRERFDICVSWGGMDAYSLYTINDGSVKS